MPLVAVQKEAARLLVKHGFLAGVVLRLFLAWFLPWLLDDGLWIPGVAYTDIDYHVFTDAANLVAAGKSPFERHTYRYTPFLALGISKVNRAVRSDNGGRYLICFADAVCGWIICKLRQKQRKQKQRAKGEGQDKQTELQFRDLLWWMFNPFAINICTRGSAESLIVLLPVLLTVALVTTHGNTATSSQGKRSSFIRAVLAGVWHGIAVHSKLYPIIYSLSYMAFFGGDLPLPTQPSQRQQRGKHQQRPLAMCLWDFGLLWFKRMTSPLPLLFFVSFVVTASFLTWLSVAMYGFQAFQEGTVYHLSRIDHRHNYSIFWYSIYLIRGKGTDSQVLSWVGRLLLLPQATLLLYSSLGIGPHDLCFCLFVQTYLFVAFNKVITAQYFTWYLCLLPLCSQTVTLDKRLGRAIAVLLMSVAFWLACAYCLEMQGIAVHRLVFVASVGFFIANVKVLSAILQSFSGKQHVERIASGKDA